MGNRSPYSLWHPFTNMRAPFRPFITFEGGEGIWLRDVDGREYINGASSLMNVTCGFGRKEIVTAIAEQAQKLAYMSLERGLAHSVAIELAEKLVEIAPSHLKKVFLSTTGSEATETVLKIIRQYAKLTDRKERYHVIALEWGYHGVSLGSMSATGIPQLQEAFEPLLPGFSHISAPYCYRCKLGKTPETCGLECANELEARIETVGRDNVAAFMVEPVICVGGVIVPPDGYFGRIQEICKKYELYLVLDEIITGFGRLGSMFGAEYFQISPDMMIISKGMNSGYLPISATLMTDEIYNDFWDRVPASDEMTFGHGSTMSGNPICCASALATIKLLEEEKIVENANRVGAYLLGKLNSLRRFSFVGDVRGAGLLMAVELVEDQESKERMAKDDVFMLVARIVRSGLCLHYNRNNLILGPPLICTEADADRIFSIMEAAFERYEKLRS